MSYHGTRSRYVGGCRCDECRAAALAYQHERRAKARAQRPDLKHGTRGTYNNGCRCEDCTQANREYSRIDKRRRSAIDRGAEVYLGADGPVDVFDSARAHDDGVRWPVEPLADIVGVHRAYVAASTTPKAIRAAGGLTDRQADRAAVRCGFHPSEIWPEWFTHADAITLAFAAIAADMRAAR
jgi:hypothetical protein